MGNSNGLKILIVASEMSPYVKTGGLADVVGSLPKALSGLDGVEVITVIPNYNAIDNLTYGIEALPGTPRFYMSGRIHGMQVRYLDRNEHWKACFVENQEYFGRDGLYGYGDDAHRFAFLCRAAMETARALGFRPDVIHCNDWHTGLLPAYLKNLYVADHFFTETATLFTIHNVAYQGTFWKEILPSLDLGWEEFKTEKLEYWDSINYLKAGIAYSDAVNTVSKRYSEEIQTPAFGEGLDGLLRQRSDVLYGIVNGLDYESWDPATEEAIAKNYDASSIENKVECKLALQRDNGLEENPEIPLIGVVSRLTYQKGLDIIADAVYDITSAGAQLVLLGTGDEHYQDMFRRIEYELSGRVGINLMFSEGMARQIYAGSDMFLMPSRYEPCGLGQLIAMRYGTIPIVRRTGGLADTVEEFVPDTGEGVGFCFETGTAGDMMAAIGRALNVYRDKANWKKIILNAMNTDFSWKHSAMEYMDVYRQAIQIRRG